MSVNRIDRIKYLMTQYRSLSRTEPSEVNSIRGLFELLQHVSSSPPHSIIEIGCAEGVSTEIWCIFFDRVVGVEIGDEPGLSGPYKNFEFVKDASPQALERFAPGEFDMCYVDADHAEEPCFADIVACKRVVKPDGWIAGHDWQHHTVQRAIRRALGNVRVHIFTDMSWVVRLPLVEQRIEVIG